MCGIVGFIKRLGDDSAASLIRKMAESITHRGPDDEGFYDDRVDERAVRLGHRRLSIIDLYSGHQPIGNEDDSLQIVFNGEIYNFASLRQELIEKGHHFKTSSDTETIIHAFEEYGERCVERLRGMFAFAIWDAKRKRLFLARDRFGKKPLFIHQNDDELIFGSEIKALLADKDVSVDVDISAVWDYLSYRYVPAPATLIRSIRKFPAGCYGVWERGALTVKRYYTPPDSCALHETVIPDDPVGAFLAKLDESVSCRMVSDVPFGAFLSGGIDSSAVVGLMSRHSDYPVKTFSVGFTESQYSELGYARVIADQFKTEHHELTVSQDNLMDELPKLVRYRDAPVAEPSDIPIYLLSREASRTVKMVLTGEGSDEFLGGYPKHVYERFVSPYQRIPGFIRHGLIEPMVQALPYRFRRAKTAILNLGLGDYEERMARWFGAMSNTEREKLAGFSAGERNSLDWLDSDSEPRSPLRAILSFDQASWLPDNLLERGDRMTMAASIEARMPFMDHELAEFTSSLPDKYRVRGMQTKWVLREAMKRLLPVSILERPKVGFRVPVNEWFRTSMRDYLCDHLLGSDSLTRHYYKNEVLVNLVKEHTEGRQNHEKLLWSLLNLEVWHREIASGS